MLKLNFSVFLQFHWNWWKIEIDVKLKLMWNWEIDMKSKNSFWPSFDFTSISRKLKKNCSWNRYETVFLDFISISMKSVKSKETVSISISHRFQRNEIVKLMWNWCETETQHSLIWNWCETVKLMWNRFSVFLQFQRKSLKSISLKLKLKFLESISILETEKVETEKKLKVETERKLKHLA